MEAEKSIHQKKCRARDALISSKHPTRLRVVYRRSGKTMKIMENYEREKTTFCLCFGDVYDVFWSSELLIHKSQSM